MLCRCPRSYIFKKSKYKNIWTQKCSFSLFCHDFCNIYAKHTRFSAIASIYFPFCRHVSSNQFVLAYCVNQLFQLPIFRRSAARFFAILCIPSSHLTYAYPRTHSYAHKNPVVKLQKKKLTYANAYAIFCKIFYFCHEIARFHESLNGFFHSFFPYISYLSYIYIAYRKLSRQFEIINNRLRYRTTK